MRISFRFPFLQQKIQSTLGIEQRSFDIDNKSTTDGDSTIEKQVQSVVCVVKKETEKGEITSGKTSREIGSEICKEIKANYRKLPSSSIVYRENSANSKKHSPAGGLLETNSNLNDTKRFPSLLSEDDKVVYTVIREQSERVNRFKIPKLPTEKTTESEVKSNSTIEQYAVKKVFNNRSIETQSRKRGITYTEYKKRNKSTEISTKKSKKSRIEELFACKSTHPTSVPSKEKKLHAIVETPGSDLRKKLQAKELIKNKASSAQSHIIKKSNFRDKSDSEESLISLNSVDIPDLTVSPEKEKSVSKIELLWQERKVDLKSLKEQKVLDSGIPKIGKNKKKRLMRKK